MSIEWFFISILAGYWFLIRWNVTKYRIFRDTGYHVFFKSAIAGVVLFSLAQSFITLCFDPGYISDSLWSSLLPVPNPEASLMSFVLGTAIPLLSNIFYQAPQAAKRNALKNGDLIEVLIANSLEEEKAIEITLKSRKVFVGYALQNCISSHGEPSDIAIMPLESGYRDSETQDLILTREYADLIATYLEEENEDEVLPDFSIEDFQIIVPMSEITSARIFDFNLFEKSAENSSTPYGETE